MTKKSKKLDTFVEVPLEEDLMKLDFEFPENLMKGDKIKSRALKEDVVDYGINNRCHSCDEFSKMSDFLYHIGRNLADEFKQQERYDWLW